MLNQSRLLEFMALYKDSFPQWFNGRNQNGERFKWEAVQWFQSSWDLEAEDFPAMLQQALLRTGKLLASAEAQYYPRQSIQNIARKWPEETRSMFRELYREDTDVVRRIAVFKEKAIRMQRQLQEKEDIANDQTENAITTYLWLRYPDRYYVYRHSGARASSQALGASLVFRPGDHERNLRTFFAYCDELCGELGKDGELISMVRDALDNVCYPDPGLRTLTFDFCFYVSRVWDRDRGSGTEGWIQPEYAPNLTAEDWSGLWRDGSVFFQESRKIAARILDAGGEASCTQLAEKYGGSVPFYTSDMARLGHRIAQKTGCPLPAEGSPRPGQWMIPFQGRRARDGEEGVYVYRLRPELLEALRREDLSGVPLREPVQEPGARPEPSVQPEPPEREPRFWRLTVSPRVWDFSRLGVGERMVCSLRLASGRLREEAACFQAARTGDPVLVCENGYAGKRITALARVAGEADAAALPVEKTEGLSLPLEPEALAGWPEVRDLPLFDRPGTLGPLTGDQYGILLDLIREENPERSPEAGEPYTREDFFREVYMEEETRERMVWLLEESRNLILQGPPGVGKSHTARRLAWSMLGRKDPERVETVQFHQSYAYEDFVLGYKPDREGFRLRPGVFFRFCRRAASRPGEKFFFLIDEINRGNLSRIFGELLMLLERDYRNTVVTLAGGIPFSVPDNVYVIGTMNTADRSLALLDYALRRRFRFLDLEPCFELESFQAYQRGLNSGKLDRLIDLVKALNREIQEDRALGPGCRIGHSYFCGRKTCTDQWLESIVESDLLPILREYWFDDDERVRGWAERLRGALR